MSDLSTSTTVKKRNVKAPTESQRVEDIDTKKDKVPTRRTPKLKPPTLWQWIKFVIKILIVLGIITGVIIYNMESPITPHVVSLPSPRPLEGALEPNTRLLDGVKILEGKIRGPECLAEYKGKLYTGTYDGAIVRITNETKMTSVARLGSRPCGSPVNEPSCGRPLGLRVIGNEIYVMDGYKGLFQISTRGKVDNLVPSDRTYEQFPIKYGSDMEKLKNPGGSKDLFFIDSCKNRDYRQQDYILWEAEGCGRLMWYNPVSKMSNIAIKMLFYPTGIQFSPDEDFLLISEATRFRILKYYFKGPLSGDFTIFAKNLPGAPMKIRPSASGGYWVGLSHVGGRMGSLPIIDILYARPWLRSLITKFVDPVTLTKWIPNYGMIIELDQKGKIVQSLHDPTGEMVSSISSVLDTGDALYLGSEDKNYILKIGMKDRKEMGKSTKA
ncbi:adipocyte plasma membrane-associated protein-like [Asterias amurensis]|uniref:adipocyte plasma membrane-associated protein-like n=1 Tax=Asterias amurensis TaxID=7602 RepID=UPI003AB1FBE6